MIEIWKDIKGYEGLYQVSNLGRVKNNKDSILKGEITKNGYVRYTLKNKKILAHRLVAEAFIPNPNNLPQVNHKDFDRKNNNKSNLEWITPSDNVKYSFNKGRIKLPYNLYENIRKQGSMYGKINGEKNSKKILQFDLKGNLIKEWDSINKASRDLKISLGHISDCLRGKRKTYKSYIWRYKDDSK